ncbi:MAG TPA: hypothetical protein PK264_18380, partial [Hyphomicrobiaceae bacterium]|nr:hypothetical protein [Hyphomicrobiaceae bacterium]
AAGRPAGARALRGALVATVAMLAATLGGCLEGRVLLDVRADGNAGVVIDAKGAPEFKEVLDLIPATMGIAPSPMARAGAGKPGCEAIAAAMEADPATPPIGKTIKAKQSMAGNRPACTFSMDIGKGDELVQAIEKGLAAAATMPGQKMEWLKVKSEGPRRYRFEFDLERYFADERANMQETVKMLIGMAGAGVPADSVLAKIAQAYDRAMLGTTRVMAKGYEAYRFDVAIRAPKIIETNMKRDGNTASFGYSFADWVKFSESVDSRKGQKVFVVFEY